ncbi:MAG: hypothetical protein LH631_10120 [Alkalinema sp. CAN_BIN05]|nr:hypothetical protein [Alkalinema sp. CAN_BIN05]
MTVSSMSAWTGLQQSVEQVLQLLNEEPSLGTIAVIAQPRELGAYRHFIHCFWRFSMSETCILYVLPNLSE